MKDASLRDNISLKAYDLLRRVLIEDLAPTENLRKGELEADESYFGGQQKGERRYKAGHKTICIGMLERAGKVSVSMFLM